MLIRSLLIEGDKLRPINIGPWGRLPFQNDLFSGLRVKKFHLNHFNFFMRFDSAGLARILPG
jgi:hypothetical protein